MQRDDWYSLGARAERSRIARRASAASPASARRAGSARVSSRRWTARSLFEAPVATGLIGHFVNAVSGGSLYRKSSFLLDSLGQAGLRAADHDSRGAASSARAGVGAVRRRRRRDATARRGPRRRSCTDTSSAATRRASSGSCRPATPAATTTSSSVTATKTSPALLRRMGRGLLVTELLGQGVNPVTGDYSRGAAGYWVEGGEIAYPGRGDHHRRQPRRDVSRHRRDRQRRRSPRLAPLRLGADRLDDGRR